MDSSFPFHSFSDVIAKSDRKFEQDAGLQMYLDQMINPQNCHYYGDSI